MVGLRFRALARGLVVLLIACSLIACQSISPSTPETTASSTTPASPEETTSEQADSSQGTISDPEPTPESASVPTATVLEKDVQPTESDAVTVGKRVFEIVQEQSEVRFLVEEVLLGADKTVVGVTSQITGTFTVDPDNPTAATIGAITIDARDLTTDSRRRNRSIQRRILGSASDEFRYITFEPAAIEGLPESVSIGETFAFRVTGDLTIRGVSRPEIFTLNVTPLSASELTGLGVATVFYPDYELAIPEVPAVAGVEDEVRLEIEFVAAAVK